ncbi:MAG TPA: class I SAM-dependent methyltransferase [Nocardioidaceae bacterium]|nr:class I SAM-dependent methyltransferase [Nocardioidaceae bacterium]
MSLERWSIGDGPGPHSPDGFAVEITRRVEPAGVPELLHAALSPSATVLELGAGTGRISDALAALGHPTTALDHSADMLALVKRAEPVLADMRDCDLRRTFDAVVLATFLINVPDLDMRTDFLRACRRHVSPSGQVFIQRQVPDRFDQVKPSVDQWYDGGRRETVNAHLDGDLLTVSEAFTVGGQKWNHTFVVRRIADAELPDVLAEAGLRLDRWLSSQWLVARPA